MYRIVSILVILFLALDLASAQDATDVDTGIEQSRRMPRGRRSRDEVRSAAGEEVANTIPDPAKVTTVSSAKELLPENTPFPPRGFATGTVIVIGDDSGPMGTYRLAFKYEASGQVFPFVECKMFEAFENYLDEHGPKARHGDLTVEVKGYVTQYRDANFLVLHDYRMPPGKLPGGGRPAAPGSATTKPE